MSAAYAIKTESVGGKTASAGKTYSFPEFVAGATMADVLTYYADEPGACREGRTPDQQAVFDNARIIKIDNGNKARAVSTATGTRELMSMLKTLGMSAREGKVAELIAQLQAEGISADSAAAAASDDESENGS